MTKNVYLLYGPDEFFVRRGLSNIKQAFSKEHPEAEIEECNAKDYAKGQLRVLGSPSLFSSAKLIHFTNLASMSEDFLNDALTDFPLLEDDVWVVMHHNGGNRGKKLIDAVRKNYSSHFLECKGLKNDRDRTDFIMGEFRNYRTKISRDAAEILVRAVGADTANLASAASQLAQDSQGEVTQDFIEKYYQGNAEISAFKICDAIMAKQTRQAISLYREAIEHGNSHIPILSALISRVRNIGLVLGNPDPLPMIAQQFEVTEWQLKTAKKDAYRFRDSDIAQILEILAQTDVELKGGSNTPDWSMESAILKIARW